MTDQQRKEFDDLWIQEFGSLPKTKAERDDASTYAIAMDFFEYGIRSFVSEVQRKLDTELKQSREKAREALRRCE